MLLTVSPLHAPGPCSFSAYRCMPRPLLFQPCRSVRTAGTAAHKQNNACVQYHTGQHYDCPCPPHVISHFPTRHEATSQSFSPATTSPRRKSIKATWLPRPCLGLPHYLSASHRTRRRATVVIGAPRPSPTRHDGRESTHRRRDAALPVSVDPNTAAKTRARTTPPPSCIRAQFAPGGEGEAGQVSLNTALITAGETRYRSDASRRRGAWPARRVRAPYGPRRTRPDPARLGPDIEAVLGSQRGGAILSGPTAGRRSFRRLFIAVMFVPSASAAVGDGLELLGLLWWCPSPLWPYSRPSDLPGQYRRPRHSAAASVRQQTGPAARDTATNEPQRPRRLDGDRTATGGG